MAKRGELSRKIRGISEIEKARGGLIIRWSQVRVLAGPPHPHIFRIKSLGYQPLLSNRRGRLDNFVLVSAPSFAMPESASVARFAAAT